MDASLDAIVATRSGAGAVDEADELHVQAWQRPSTAVCLLVDRSGSMAGDRLYGAVAAASVLFRAPLDCSVVAFAEDAVVVKAQDEVRSPDVVVGDLLRLRGFGVTRPRPRAAGRRRPTRAPTPGGAYPPDVGLPGHHRRRSPRRRHPELAVLAPLGDTADAEALATALGARWTSWPARRAMPGAISTVLLG